MMKYPKNLFITGMLRSGTTLLEKLINTCHPSSHILYQPCMLLFTEVKKNFISSLGYEAGPYPLGLLFCEDRYRLKDFECYLETFQPTIWPGLSEDIKKIIKKGTFAEILPKVWRWNLCDNPKLEILGAKDVLCEEYTPYLVNHGFKVIFVVRDPRDVIASMNYGKAFDFVGRTRPTLYNLRNWRKSVAFALHLSKSGKAVYIKYEDLVNSPEQSLKKILSWLGGNISGFELNLQSGIKDSQGKKWKGNSSFGETKTISTRSVGRFKTLLPQMLIKYIEAICCPEMQILGYSSHCKISHENAEKIISSFHEPIPVDHPAIPVDYSIHPDNVLKENKRLKFLFQKKCVSVLESERFFIFNDVFEMLQGRSAE